MLRLAFQKCSEHHLNLQQKSSPIHIQMEKQSPQQNHICSICLTVFITPVSIRQCHHCFCAPCIEFATQYNDKKRCPLCRQAFKLTDLVPQKQLETQLLAKYPQQLKQKQKNIRQKIVYGLKVGNTTNFLDESRINKYEWSFYVQPKEGQAALQKYAERIEVELHPSFMKSHYEFLPTQKIQINKKGWGTFRIDIKIFWKKQFGGFTELYHDLEFEPKHEKTLNCQFYRNPAAN